MPGKGGIFLQFLGVILITLLITIGAACSKLKPEDPVVITFSTFESSWDIFEPLMEEFHRQNPGIRVQFLGSVYEDFSTAADTHLSAGDLQWERSWIYLDLQPFVDSDPSLEADDFWPGALEACRTPDGRLAGIPFHVHNYSIIFNEEAFASAGLAAPAPGWTYDDFRTAAAVLAHAGEENFQYSYADFTSLHLSVLSPLIIRHLDLHGGEIHNQLLEDEIGWYFDLAKEQAIYPVTEVIEEGTKFWSNMFDQGSFPVMRVGLFWDGEPWFLGRNTEFEKFAPFPLLPDDPRFPTMRIGATCISIHPGSANPQAAWTWVNFLSRQWDKELGPFQIYMYIPSRRSTAERMGYFQSLPEEIREVMLFGLEHGLAAGEYIPALNAIDKAIKKTLAGRSSLSSALDEAAVEIAEALKQPAATTPVAVPTPFPADAKIIKFGIESTGRGEILVLNELAQNFIRDHPGLILQVLPMHSLPPGGDQLDVLPQRYDCFTWSRPYWDVQTPHNLLSLEAYLDAEGQEFRLDFYPAQLDIYRVNGTLYGLPAASWPQVMAYNADLLARRGLDPPSAGWTFDDFLNLAILAASTTPGDASYGFISYGYAYTDLLLKGRGAAWGDFQAVPPSASFNTPEMINALAWLAELKESNVLFVEEEAGFESTRQVFRDGQIAFWSASSPEATDSFLNPRERAAFSIGLAPMPTSLVTGSLSGSSLETGYYISRETNEPQACWNWIKYISGQPTATGGIPARRSVVASQAWEAMVGEAVARVYRTVLDENAASAWEADNSLTWPLEEWLRKAVLSVLGGAEPRLALEEAQFKADRYIACIGPYSLEANSRYILEKEVSECARHADP